MEKNEQDYNLFDWWKKVVLKNYANFNGRARRKEYWYFVLTNLIFSIIFEVIDAVGDFNFGSPEARTGIFSTIYSLAILIPSLAVAVRRMHDVGKSGWFLLIPIYNLILAVTEGQNGTNEYGEDPKNPHNEINEIGKPQE